MTDTDVAAAVRIAVDLLRQDVLKSLGLWPLSAYRMHAEYVVSHDGAITVAYTTHEYRTFS